MINPIYTTNEYTPPSLPKNNFIHTHTEECVYHKKICSYRIKDDTYKIHGIEKNQNIKIWCQNN